MDGHSLCKRHRTVATSNVNATSTQSGYVVQNYFGKTSGSLMDGWTFVMQTTPRPYGGDLKRTNKRYQDRTVATPDGWTFVM